MSELTHLSLFSGIGGLDIAGEWAGFRTVGQCEWADYPHAVLQKHWPDVPKWRDIRTFTKEGFRERTGLDTVTVVSGGFPCQPFSTAGKRRGKEDDRYLWPEMCRVISEIQPTWVVGENVAGLISMDLDTVLSDLEGIGYACQTLVIPACAVDAPHRRDRCAILAYSQSQRRGEKGKCFFRSQEWAAGSGSLMANTDGGAMRNDGDHRRTSDREVYETVHTGISCGAGKIDPYADGKLLSDTLRARRGGAGPGDIHTVIPDPHRIRLEEPWLQRCSAKSPVPIADNGRWPAEPNVGRVAHGVPARVDRLRCLGNAVVPQQFHPIFRAIADIERSFT